MNNQELIKQKVDELIDLFNKQQKEQTTPDYKGVKVSCFMTVGFHDKKEGNELHSAVIGDSRGIYSAIKKTTEGHPELAMLVHDAVCPAEQEGNPFEELLKLFNHGR